MRKKSKLLNRLKRYIQLVLIIVFMCAFLHTPTAQEFKVYTDTGFGIEINAQNSRTLCQDPSPFWDQKNTYFWMLPEVAPAGTNAIEGVHHIVQAGRPYELIVDIPAVGGLYLNYNLRYKYGEAGGEEELIQFTDGDYEVRPGFVRHRIPYEFTVGTREGYLAFDVVDGLITEGGRAYACVLRFIVEGSTVNGNVPILDTITEPQMPYLILHAPPGDQSSSSFVKGKKMCRKQANNYATEGSNSVKTAAKIGIAGEVGLFVTTKFEFSVTISAGLSFGDMSYQSTTDETCINISEGFSTSSMLDDDGGGDVFIGYGTDLAVGAYPLIAIDQELCRSVLDTGLAFAPVGDVRQFALTKTGIQSRIEDLEAIIANAPNQDPRSLNDAQNQIDVWHQVLDINDTNVNNPDNEPMGVAFDLDATTSIDRSEQVTTSQTSTIEYKRYTKVNLGVSTKVEVAGSGFEGGYEFAGSRTYGQSTNTSAEETKLISYTLEDDDGGDNFRIQVQRDPMFGTPIFKVDENASRSSCPYQRGYQRDQPLLQLTNGNNEITLENIPIGEAATFQIQVCNDSNEDRTYHLKGNSNTNLDDVILTGFGNNLFNTNDKGVEFANVPANNCLDPATITVKQSNDNILDYQGIELLLNVDCQPTGAPIKSSIIINAHFGEMTSTEDASAYQKSFTAYPNPAQEVIYVRFTEDYPTEGYLQIVNMNGQVVKNTPVSPNSKSMMIEIGDMEVGIYQLLYSNDTHQQVERIVIMK